jgi:hypothetical protein
MADLRSLYALGFRNFAVTKLQPVGCLPTYTMAFDYTMCNDIVNTLTPIHNSLLDTELNLTMQLYMREANLIYLDMETVFNDILTRQPTGETQVHFRSLDSQTRIATHIAAMKS